MFSRIMEIRDYLKKQQDSGKMIGFVPTMGALHEGHLSLINRSKSENDITVCSIFVNPIQFNNKSDLEKYPRKLDDDIHVLDKTGCDVVFTPEVEEMYPGGKEELLEISFGNLDKVLEGKYRPGHFKGVAIVVKKLFEIVQPQNAYFGKKDYQQFLIVRHMVSALKLPVEITGCPIIREKDGLAMSSRNLRMTLGERKIAPRIFEILYKVKEKAGTLPLIELKNWAVRKIEENPSFRVEYLEITDQETLTPLNSWSEKKKGIILAAIYLGDIRLIDNLEFFCNFAA